MESKFGLKDFLLMVCVIAVGVLVVMGMRQDDRQWRELRELGASVDDAKRTLASIERRVESGVEVIGSSSGSGRESPVGGQRDESWARPGVPVTWMPPLVSPYDARDDPDYREGGTFTEIFEAQFPKVTPFLYADVYGRRIVLEAACECLAEYDPETLEYRALLGEAYQFAPDGMWLRVKINDRARFSDGEPVTARDAEFTIEDFVFNPELQTERFRSVLNVIDHVDVISERVVEFHFTEPNFSNLEQAMRFPIIPEHFYSTFTPSQINQSTGLLLGSGPYRLETLDPDNQWSPGQDLVLVRNERYWGNRPAFDRRRYAVVDDKIARLTAYENGRGDMMRATHEQYRRKTEDPGFVRDNYVLAWNNMRSGYAFIAWNGGERNGRLTPFHDKRVRLAMTHLLDRERIKRDIYKGLGRICTGPFSSSGPMSDPSVEPWPYDLEKARALLEEAGWVDRDGDGVLENARGDEFSFELTYAQGSSVGPQLGAYIKDQCAKVGIRCEIRVVDWAIYAQILNGRDFDALTMQWSQSNPESDPYQLWHSSSIQNQGDNFVSWNSPKGDELIEHGRQTLDFEKRMEIWHELHRLIHDEQPYTFVVEPPWVRFISKRIQNVYTYPRGLNINEMYTLD